MGCFGLARGANSARLASLCIILQFIRFYLNMLPSYPLSEEAIQQLHVDIIEALKGIYDPEIPVNIYDLGLIYEVKISAFGIVNIDMTLTTPHCPVAQTFPAQVETAVSLVSGVSEAHVILVWDPPWTMEKMSEAARLQLNMF